jgi:hypothetical protein
MTELLKVQGAGFRSLVAAQMVTRRAYIGFLEAAGRPIPPQLTRSGSVAGAAAWVSQVEAAEFCAWLGKREGGQYRLPSVAELGALHALAEQESLGVGLWPADVERQALDCTKSNACICEWTRETEEVPIYGTGEVRVLGSIFYPPWLRAGNNVAHVQAHMLASEGYSWIGFRIAQNG